MASRRRLKVPIVMRQTPVNYKFHIPATLSVLLSVIVFPDSLTLSFPIIYYQYQFSTQPSKRRKGGGGFVMTECLDKCNVTNKNVIVILYNNKMYIINLEMIL